MTEADAIMTYVRQHGAITPARMHAKVYNGHFFGSEVTRQCRYLRSQGLLASRRVGKFTEFFLPSDIQKPKVEKRYVNIGGVMKEIVIQGR